MFDLKFWISIIIVVALSTAGGALYKHATNLTGELTFQQLANPMFTLKFLFTPLVFLSLVVLFLSRFLLGIPLSTSGLGQLSALVTVLVMMSTVITGVLVFSEQMTMRLALGLLFGVISLLLVGSA